MTLHWKYSCLCTVSLLRYVMVLKTISRLGGCGVRASLMLFLTVDVIFNSIVLHWICICRYSKEYVSCTSRSKLLISNSRLIYVWHWRIIVLYFLIESYGNSGFFCWIDVVIQCKITGIHIVGLKLWTNYRVSNSGVLYRIHRRIQVIEKSGRMTISLLNVKS